MTTINVSNSALFLNFEDLKICPQIFKNNLLNLCYFSYLNTLGKSALNNEKKKYPCFERKTSPAFKNSISPIHPSIYFPSLLLLPSNRGAGTYSSCLTLKAEVTLWRSCQIIDNADRKTTFGANIHTYRLIRVAS